MCFRNFQTLYIMDMIKFVNNGVYIGIRRVCTLRYMYITYDVSKR